MLDEYAVLADDDIRRQPQTVNLQSGERSSPRPIPPTSGYRAAWTAVRMSPAYWTATQ